MMSAFVIYRPSPRWRASAAVGRFHHVARAISIPFDLSGRVPDQVQLDLEEGRRGAEPEPLEHGGGHLAHDPDDPLLAVGARAEPGRTAPGPPPRDLPVLGPDQQLPAQLPEEGVRDGPDVGEPDAPAHERGGGLPD